METSDPVAGKAAFEAVPARDALRPMQVLTLALAGDVFAIESSSVLEVLDVGAIAEVPNCRPFVKGLINVRGKVVPVVDLKTRLGIRAAAETTRDSRIVVLSIDHNGDESLVGVLADKVYEVTDIAPTAQEETPSIGINWHAEFIKAIGKTADAFIVVVDIGRVFASEDGATKKM